MAANSQCFIILTRRNRMYPRGLNWSQTSRMEPKQKIAAQFHHSSRTQISYSRHGNVQRGKFTTSPWLAKSKVSIKDTVVRDPSLLSATAGSVSSAAWGFRKGSNEEGESQILNNNSLLREFSRRNQTCSLTLETSPTGSMKEFREALLLGWWLVGSIQQRVRPGVS